MTSLPIVPIFDYSQENYGEKFLIEHFVLNEEWKKNNSIYEHLERYGFNTEFICNINDSIFSPIDFCNNLDTCLESNLKLFAKTIGYQEIDKVLLLSQIKDLPAYLMPFHKFLLLLTSTKFKSTAEEICDLLRTCDYKVIDTILESIPTYALLNYLYNGDIKNKYFCLGPGRSLNQIIPHYIIDDINKNNEKYEIFIFEDCEDGDFGCPDAKNIYKYLEEKIGVDKIFDIKFYHILVKIEPLVIWNIMKSIYIPNTQIIICDTIGTNHDLKSELDKYNERLRIINEITNNNFSTDFLNTNKIISYLCTGQKIIFYSPVHNKFVGHHTNQTFVLDILQSEIIKNNNIEKDYDFGGKSYYKKYIKYKNKYLKIKTTLTK